MLTETVQGFPQMPETEEVQRQTAIFKNDLPNCADALENTSIPDLTDDEKIDIAAAQILKRFLPAFQELAK